jgi:hypothetical protein
MNLESHFRINLKTMTIHKKDTPFTLGIPDYSKRCRVYNDDGKWIDTIPIHIT